MAEPKKNEIVTQNEKPNLEPKNIFSMLPRIEFKFPFFNQNPEKRPEALVKKEEVDELPKPPSLFLGKRQKLPPPLEFQAEEGIGRTSNPIVLWQVYAIGGFFLLKWIWARWKERKEMGAKKESSDDDEQPPPTDDESQYI